MRWSSTALSVSIWTECEVTLMAPGASLASQQRSGRGQQHERTLPTPDPGVSSRRGSPDCAAGLVRRLSTPAAPPPTQANLTRDLSYLFTTA